MTPAATICVARHTRFPATGQRHRGKRPVQEPPRNHKNEPTKGWCVVNQEQVKVKGAAKNAATARPSEDELYLADRINQQAERGFITPAAIQGWHRRFGYQRTISALRLVRGFTEQMDSAYAYVESVLLKSRADERLARAANDLMGMEYEP